MEAAAKERVSQEDLTDADSDVEELTEEEAIGVPGHLYSSEV